MGPRYTCTLCDISAYPPEMIHHVIGRKHRQKYIETKRPDLVTWDKHSLMTETGKIIRMRAEIIARQDGSGCPKPLKKIKNMENVMTRVPSLQRQNEDPQNTSGLYQQKQEFQDSHCGSFAPDPLTRAPFISPEARSMNVTGGRQTTNPWDQHPARADDWEGDPRQGKSLDLEYRLDPVTQTRNVELYKETQRGWDQPAEGYTTYREQEVKNEIFTKDGRHELHPQRSDYRGERWDSQPQRPDSQAPRSDHQIQHLDYQAERWDSKPQRSDYQPQRSDYQPQRSDYQPQRSDYQPQRSDYQPQRSDYQPQRSDYQPQRSDYQPQRSDYQPQRSDYQPQRQDYKVEYRDSQPQRLDSQAPRLDYQVERPDSQARCIDYKAQRSESPLQRPDSQPQRANYQSPHPDYQSPHPDYQSQGPGFQGDDQQWFSEKDQVVRLGSSVPEPPTRNVRLPSDQPVTRLRDYNHGMRQADSLSGGPTNFQTPREDSRSMSSIPENFRRFMNGLAGDGATGPRKRKSRFSDATAEEVANANKMFHLGPPDAKSRAPLELDTGVFEQETRTSMCQPDRLSQSQQNSSTFPPMSSQQPYGRTFREESNFRRSEDRFGGAGNGGGRDWNNMRGGEQALQQQGRREPSDLNRRRYEAGFGQEQMHTARRSDERAQYRERFRGAGQQRQFQQHDLQHIRSRSPPLEMETSVEMYQNPQFNRSLQKLSSTILELMARNS
ncbi:uncharacterized protein LOC144007586 isoform X2 [Festucalex cinctus]